MWDTFLLNCWKRDIIDDSILICHLGISRNQLNSITLNCGKSLGSHLCYSPGWKLYCEKLHFQLLVGWESSLPKNSVYAIVWLSFYCILKVVLPYLRIYKKVILSVKVNYYWDVGLPDLAHACHTFPFSLKYMISNVSEILPGT